MSSSRDKLFKFSMRIFMTSFYTFSLPTWPLMLLIHYTYSKVAWLLAKIFQPDLIGQVRGVDSFFTTDNIFHNPSATLVPLTILDGHLQQEKVLDHFQQIYGLRDEETGNRRYEKLGYTVKTWMGYWYWVPVQNFDITKQIVFLNQENLEISSFVEEIIRKPYERGGPLWEVFVVQHNKQNKSYLFWRVHHIIMDGVSLLRLWNYEDNGVDPDKDFSFPKYKASDAKPRKGWSKLCRRLDLMCIRTPYLSNLYISNTRDHQQNVLMKDYKDDQGPWFCSQIKKIHTSKYRESLKSVGFTLTHALLLGYTRGFERFLLNHYEKKKVPKKVHLMASVPRPNYPMEHTMTNHWSFIRYTASFKGSKEASLVQQLNVVANEYKRSVDHVIPELFLENFKTLASHMPPKVSDFFWNTRKSGTLSLSNIPGAMKSQKMLGLDVSDRAIWLPLSRNNSGIGLLLMTYNGWATVTLTADSGCIKTREKFNDLCDCIVQEFQHVLNAVERLSYRDQNSNVILVEPTTSHAKGDETILTSVKIV